MSHGGNWGWVSLQVKSEKTVRGCVKTIDTPPYHSISVILSNAKNLIISTR